jgi:hypothetical protein
MLALVGNTRVPTTDESSAGAEEDAAATERPTAVEEKVSTPTSMVRNVRRCRREGFAFVIREIVLPDVRCGNH